MWNILFSPRTLPDPPTREGDYIICNNRQKTLYKKDFTSCYSGLLLIVILSIAKNPYSHLKSIQRCFALLNMTFLEHTYKQESREIKYILLL